MRTKWISRLIPALMLALISSAGFAGPVQAAPVAGTQPIAVPAGLQAFDHGANQGAYSGSTLNCLARNGYTVDLLDVIGTAYAAEYANAIAAGVSVALFQGYDPSTWANPGTKAASINGDNGYGRGNIIAAKAADLGYPHGGVIFLDLEDTVQPGVTRASMVTWVQNWASRVQAAGYSTGLYLGGTEISTSADLPAMTRIGVFWSSTSHTDVPVPAHGSVLAQTAIDATDSSTCGQRIDKDTVGRDTLGRRLMAQGVTNVAATPTAPGSFVAVPPSRLLDTRGAGSGVPSTGVVALSVAGRGGVPADAAAVAVNVTAVSPTAAGNLSVFPAGSALPTVSNVNFDPGQTVANLVFVPVGDNGAIDLSNNSTGRTKILVDVQGYVVGGSTGGVGAYAPVIPQRITDTRATHQRVASNQTLTVTVAGRAGLPAASEIAAVAVNVTAVTPGGAGNVVVYPADAARPGTSNLNFAAGQTTAGLTLVRVSAGGQLTIADNSVGSTDLVVDVQGYVRNSGSAPVGGSEHPLKPSRILDTRTGMGAARGAVPPTSALSVAVLGQGGVPGSGVAAVIVSVTAVAPTGPGNVAVFPDGLAAPTVSDLNFVAGATVPNLVLAPVGADGRIVLANDSTGSTQLLADVQGWVQAA